MISEELQTQSGGKVNVVELATGLLILRKFDEVFKLCQKGLAKFVSLSTDNKSGNAHLMDEDRESPGYCNEDTPRNCHGEKRKHRQRKICVPDLMKECLCIIAVQALAEMNRCQDILPFLQNQYGPIQNFPTKLVQLCMVLHVHLNEHQQAENIYKQYSELSTQKLSSEQHTHLIELFFMHVLSPQEKWTEAAKIIENDRILRTDKKLALLKILKDKERSRKRDSVVDGSHSVVEDNEPQEENNRLHGGGNILFLMASKVSRFVCRWIPKTYWSQLSSLAMVGVCAYLVLLRYNSDVSSWQSYTVALWFSITRLWQTMFAAYYKIIH